MGIVAIGGLVTSTFLTLLVVPVVYTLLDDVESRVLRLARGRAAARTEEEQAPAG
jgi:hypothetical protein